jgi:hypothetical protein
MKNVISRTIGARVGSAMILAAATLTLSMTTTYAQSSAKMKAEIPFSFHVGKAEYPAGSYETTILTNSSGSRIFTIANVNTGVTRFALPAGSLYAANAARYQDQARLVFRCNALSTLAPGDSGCSLAQVWPGNAANGVFMNTPSTKGNKNQHLAVIGLRPANAD